MKKQKDVYRMPGPVQLRAFLIMYGDMFNMSEIERQCKFPSGTLRHIRTNGREMRHSEYKELQKVLLPKLCELVLLMQLYQALDQDK